MSGINDVPANIVTFLRGNRELVFDYLGGNERDRPPLELLSTLDIELVYCTDYVTAESVIAEIIADAGVGPIAIYIETTARPEYANPVPLRLTVRGRPMKVQPRPNDKVALDPHRSEPRLIQVFGGGIKAAVLDMRSCPGLCSRPSGSARWSATTRCSSLPSWPRTASARAWNARCRPRVCCWGVEQRGLDDACFWYLGVEVPKDLQTSDWGAPALSWGQLATCPGAGRVSGSSERASGQRPVRPAVASTSSGRPR